MRLFMNELNRMDFIHWRQRSTICSVTPPPARPASRTPSPIRTGALSMTMTTHLDTQGLSIPRLGFGTFRMPGGGCQPVVESALSLGYRHIDTAAMYENEDAVGAAIAGSGVKRDELFVTTKVWHDQLGRGAVRKAFDTSLSKLKLDYVDMYMIHWPAADMDLPAVLEEMMT